MTGPEIYVGKNISEICGNGYDEAIINHWAHFVAHALSLDIAYTCKKQTGGIRHKGRGKYRTMKTALASRNPRDALLSMNSAHADRSAALDGKSRRLEQQGKLGVEAYRRATQELV